MKTKSILFPVLFAVTAFAFLTGCSGNKKEDSAIESQDEKEHESGRSNMADASDPQFQVDRAFQQQLGKVFTAYVALKDAFVSSDAEKIKAEASGTRQALNKVDMKLLSGAAHRDWINYQAPIQTSLKEVEATPNIEAQRESFSILSDNLYKSIKAFGLGEKEAFYEFCPMAFNNQGAYWLSDQKQIRNPYFGEKMLTCGEVKEKLK
jgi:membrane-associated HD superfamily phosphohydrolase